MFFANGCKKQALFLLSAFLSCFEAELKEGGFYCLRQRLCRGAAEGEGAAAGVGGFLAEVAPMGCIKTFGFVRERRKDAAHAYAATIPRQTIAF